MCTFCVQILRSRSMAPCSSTGLARLGDIFVASIRRRSRGSQNTQIDCNATLLQPQRKAIWRMNHNIQIICVFFYWLLRIKMDEVLPETSNLIKPLNKRKHIKPLSYSIIMFPTSCYWSRLQYITPGLLYLDIAHSDSPDPGSWRFGISSPFRTSSLSRRRVR